MNDKPADDSLLRLKAVKSVHNKLVFRSFLRNSLASALLSSVSVLCAQTNTPPATPAAPATGAAPPSTAAAGGLTAADKAGIDAGSLIMLPFFVLAKNEQPIANLPQDGVTVQEDGHPETIQKLLHAGDQPLVLSLLVDTRANDNGILEKGRAPLEKFTEGVMTQPADRAAVIDFNDDAGLDLGLTGSKDKLHASLEKLHAKASSGNTSNNGDDRNVNGNVLFDALFLASDEVIKDQPGRKAIVVLTDGVDRGSKESILSAIEAAQHAHAVVYTIGFPAKELKGDSQQQPNRQQGGRQGGGFPGGGVGFPGGGGGGGYPGGGGGYPGGGRRNGGGQQAPSPQRKDAKKVLLQISADSGGHYYEISSKLSIEQALASITDQLKNEYMLIYAPPSREDREEGFHHLNWATKDKSQLLQAASGFYINR